MNNNVITQFVTVYKECCLINILTGAQTQVTHHPTWKQHSNNTLSFLKLQNCCWETWAVESVRINFVVLCCRYRIQQAVKRLYDGYLAEGRLEAVRGGGRNPHESSIEHDSHNDSGYSTRLCTGSQGPSPALSGGCWFGLSHCSV